MRAICPANPILFDLITVIFGEAYNLRSFSLCWLLPKETRDFENICHYFCILVGHRLLLSKNIGLLCKRMQKEISESEEKYLTRPAQMHSKALCVFLHHYFASANLLTSVAGSV
jgi:hypothetical protein